MCDLLLLFPGLYPSEMPPKRIIFATNVSRFSGAGHIRRLIEVSKALPNSIEKHFFGSIEIDWVKEMADRTFLPLCSPSNFGRDDLVILDSYEEDFSLKVHSEFSDSRVIQIADRYTFILPDAAIIYMDLPFSYQDSKMESRVIAHGIEYLPMRGYTRHDYTFTDQAKRVLVTTGGSVNEHIYSQLVEELTKGKYQNVSFEFVGSFASVHSYNSNFSFHNFGSGFDSVARDCDTAISAAGTTMWDLFANRKLVGLAAMVENQRANFDYAIRTGQAIEVFDSKTLKLDVEALQSLLFDSNVRKSLYGAISGNYDFNGARRVSEVIFNNF